MIKHSKSLSRKVESYLKYLSKPNPALGGQPICPGIAPYRHQIHVLMASDDIEGQINHVADMIIPLDVPAAIIYTALPPKDLWDITDRALEGRHDIEIFISEPDKKGRVNGVYTGFEYGTLIIVQRTDLLKTARENAKTAHNKGNKKH